MYRRQKKQAELSHNEGMDSAWFMKNFAILYNMFGDAVKLGEGSDYAVMGFVSHVSQSHNNIISYIGLKNIV